jgi:hypothetical protein
MTKKKVLSRREKISISQKNRWNAIRENAEFKFARDLLLDRYKGLKRVSELKYLFFELELEYQSQVVIRKHESFLSLLADATRKSLKKSNKLVKRGN